MRVLLDECVVAGVEKLFTEIEAVTAKQAGTLGVANGRLLKFASEHFDGFMTVDNNLRYQQNLTGLKLRILVVRTRDSRLEAMSPHVQRFERTLLGMAEGDCVDLEL